MDAMYGVNFRAPQVNVHDFSMVPRNDVPRSSFRMQHNNKLTMEASLLFPIFLQEVLPGDSFACNMTAMARLGTLLFPMMDQVDLETWFFFVPNRLVWTDWVKFMGEQTNPGDSISYTIPQIVSPANGFAQLSIYDYFGLPTTGQTAVGQTISISALPLRAYNLIWHQWFRDENLNNAPALNTGDGPDTYTNYALLDTNKRHDYFTSCLPWPQKGGVAVNLPLTGNATVKTNATNLFTGVQPGMLMLTAAGAAPGNFNLQSGSAGGNFSLGATAGVAGTNLYPSNLYADMSTVTGATINALRLAATTQQLLELEARGGTRYVEIILAHFGVRSPDYRLQRPEYLGGGKTPVNVTPVPQTTGTGASGTTTPLGNLAAAGTAIARHGFRGTFTEHGHILGLAAVRQNYTYQQGIRRLWSRQTKYDFYFPVFAGLGEQAVLNKEIYSDGTTNDPLTFGYQARWDEYRYMPSITCGYFRSTNSTPLDSWHLGEKYSSLPVLGTSWLNDSTYNQLQRALAAGGAANLEQILVDLFFDIKATRPMPMYSKPGLLRF